MPQSLSHVDEKSLKVGSSNPASKPRPSVNRRTYLIGRQLLEQTVQKLDAIVQR
jgi:hypothetical protein